MLKLTFNEPFSIKIKQLTVFKITNLLATLCCTSCIKKNGKIDKSKKTSSQLCNKKSKQLSRNEHIAAKIICWTVQNTATLRKKRIKIMTK